MCSADEPQLDAPVHDAHPVLGLDAFVAVPCHVSSSIVSEPVDRDAREVALVEELLLETAEEPLRGACLGCSPSRSSSGSARGPCRCVSIPATGSGSRGPSG